MTQTLASTAYMHLRRRILAGDLPAGTPLRLATLSKELGVSMAVIREALTRLGEQGLADSEPNQGFRVVSLSTEDLQDLTELRAELETLAFARSIEKGDIAWESALIAAHHELARTPMMTPDGTTASESWIVAHATFHDSLYAGSGSPRLCQLVRNLRDQSEVYRQWGGKQGVEQGRDIAGEHRNLMELALARDSDSARAALEQHIRRTTENLSNARRASSL